MAGAIDGYVIGEIHHAAGTAGFAELTYKYTTGKHYDTDVTTLL